MFELKTTMLEDEYWYGGHTNWGHKMPVNKKSNLKVDTNVVASYGQANTIFVSNKGRLIVSEQGYFTTFKRGKISCSSAKAEIKLYESQDKTLRGAYKLAMEKFMQPDGKYPNELMFKIPQYCTWIQFDTNQNQKGILEYAQSILDCGMPAGELIIDDGWQKTFGDWKFKEQTFSDAKDMIAKLKAMGFKVIMWICPFISKKCPDYNMLVENNLLIKDKSGNIAMRKWWNGTDALLDFSNPGAQKWFFEQTDYLTEQVGVDGFKQDAGDSMYYKDDDITFGGVDANGQSELWAKSSRRYDFNELRACFKCGLMGVAQRLADKAHRWGYDGLASLLPNALLQGISGYPYTCPDMIGGGQIGDFRGKGDVRLDPKTVKLDHELLARYCQTSALMPMMQYSLNIWDLGNETTRKVCQNMTNLHASMSDYIMKYVKLASTQGEPIVRYMEYNYPNKGYANVKTQFMLGDDIIVAPTLKKGCKPKKVYIPDGQWEYKGQIYSNEITKIPCAVDELIYLTKVKQ